MTAISSVVLVDKRIHDHETIMNAVNADSVRCILFDVFEVDTYCQEQASTAFQYILNKIAELGVAGSFSNIGIVQHNNGAPFHRFFAKTQGEESTVAGVETTDPTLQTWAGFAAFITTLKTTYGVQNVDLMACALYSNPDWKYVIDTLAAQTGVTVRASTDDTGAAALGGDWFLESHTGVNLKDVYFTETIENFQGVLYVGSNYWNISGSYRRPVKSFAVGRVELWGDSTTGGSNNTSVDLSNTVGIYSNRYGAAALKTDGGLVVWGAADKGASYAVLTNHVSVPSNSLTTGVVDIVGNEFAYAAIKSNGSVVIWGRIGYGGNNNTGVDLTNVVDVYPATNVYSFAALKSNGSVVGWGNTSGTTISIPSGLSGVVLIYSNGGSYAALKTNGSIVTWGSSTYGGDSSSISGSLISGVVAVYSMNTAYAALRNNGSLVIWGSATNGGTSPGTSVNTGVIHVFPTAYSAVALKTDSSIVHWGNSSYTGTAPSLTNVVTLCANVYAFAALKSDGTVVVWGNNTSYGSSASTPVNSAALLTSGASIIALYSNNSAFAALKSDGTVVCWGNAINGGTVPAGLTGVVSIRAVDMAFAALKNDGSVVVWGLSVKGGSNNTSASISSGIVDVFNNESSFAALKTTSTPSYDLSMSYYNELDRLSILCSRDYRRTANLTANSNKFTVSLTRSLQKFNYTMPTNQALTLIVPDYQTAPYSLTSTITIPATAGGANSKSFLITSEVGERVDISGAGTYVNYGTYIYKVETNGTYTKTTSLIVNNTYYNLYGGDGFYYSGIVLYYRFGTFTVPAKTIGDASFNLTAPVTDSSGAFTYTSSDTTVATVTTGGTVTIIKAGTTTITATQAASGGFTSDSITASLVVSKVDSTLGALTVPAKVTSDAPFTLTAPTSTVSSIISPVNTITSTASVIVPPPIDISAVIFSNSWTQRGADIDGEAASNWSGYSVSTSADGTVVAIGAPINDGTVASSDRGHVRVYAWNGSSWDRRGADIDGEAANDQSGLSVSLSANGMIVAIGASYNSGNGPTAGHVRVYNWNGTSWIQRGADIDGEEAYDRSGWSVSMSADGTVVAIGAIYNNGINGIDSGHVRIYAWNGTLWVQRGADIDGEAANDQSGYSVSMSADGTVVAIGAAKNNDGTSEIVRGHVRVYNWNGTSWVQRGADIDGEAAYDQSGQSVSMSADGTVVAIGAYTNDGTSGNVEDNRGHVRIYTWNGTSWVQRGADIDGEATKDNSGIGVSLSADGTIVAIGAYNNDGTVASSNRGHVRIYVWNGTSWVQHGVDIDGEATNDLSGRGVSLSADGTTVAIGAEGNMSLAGHVRVYRVTTITNALTYSSSNSTVADVCGNLLLIKGVNGTSTITASQSGNTVTGRLDVSGTTYTLQYNPITYTIDSSSVASVSTYGTVTLTGTAGTSTITATQPETLNYASRSVTASLVVSLITPTIGALSAPAKNFGDASFNLTAPTSNSDGAFTYTSSAPGVATVTTEGTVTVVGAGSTTITATQAAAGNYSSGSVSASLVVSAIAPTIGALSAPAKNFGDAAFNLTAPTSNSGGAFTYTSSNTAVATVTSGGMVTVIGVGSTTITATQAASGNYTGGSFVTASLVVSAAAPTIGALSAPAKNFGDASFNLTAPTSNSDGAFTYTSSVPGVATVTSEGTVTVVGAGSTTITATQAAAGNYSSGSVSASLVVSAIAPTIGALSAPAKNLGDASFNLTAPTSNSDGAFTYTSSVPGVATVTSNGMVTVIGVGSTTITATQAASADGNYTGGSVTASLVVSKADSTLGALTVPAKLLGDAPFTLTAPTSSISSIISPTYTITTSSSLIVTPPDILDISYGTTWIQRGQDIDGEATDAFSGTSVSLSADGRVLAVGAFGAKNTAFEYTGHVRVYELSGNTWVQRGEDIDGETANDAAGMSVSLSADGNIIAIGAPYNDGSGNTIGNSGHVRVYRYTPNKPSVTSQTDPSFGPVGWTRLGGDIDGEGLSNYFGNNISLSADGTILAIGAYRNSGTHHNGGHVRVYRYNPTKTQPQLTNQNLSTFGPVGWDRLGADIDGEALNDESGQSISLSADGTTIAIGAPQNDGTTASTTDDRGHVRVYRYTPNKVIDISNQNNLSFGPVGWTRLGTDIDGEFAEDEAGYGLYGNSVSLSANGNTVAIGSWSNDGPTGTAINNGSVRIFDLSGNTWVKRGETIYGEAPGDYSGLSLSISQNGNIVAIGASGNNGSGKISAGHVRVYFWNGTMWTQRGQDIDGEAAGDNSGRAVSLSSDGSRVAIGAMHNDGTVSYHCGHVRVYDISVNNPITYSSSNSSVADMCGNLLLIKGVNGTSTITASQTGNTVTGRLDVSGTTYTLQYNPITYTIDSSSVATVSTYGTVTLTGVVGTTITATQPETLNYASRSVTGTLNVSSASFLSNFSVPAKTYGDASFNLTDPETTDNTVGFTFASSNPAVATLSGDGGRTVTIVGAGSSVITASQAATANRGQLDISATLVVSQATPVITAAAITKSYGNASFRPVITSTNTDTIGGLVFTFTSDNIAVVSMLDASLVRINGIGTATLSITQAASANFTDASSSVVVTVNKGVSGFSASTFAVEANKTFGDAAFAITTAPISSSTGAITYTSSDESVAVITSNGSGNAITVVGQGTVTFTASQAESALYTADTKTSNTLTVVRKTAALSRDTPAADTISKGYGNANFFVIATNESNGAFSFTSSDSSIATIDASTGEVTIVAIGSTTLTATRAQTAQYNAASVSWTLNIARGTTTLTGLSSLSRSVALAPFTVSATSASDGAVSYALQDPSSTILTIHPTTGRVRLKSPGSAVIVVSQAQGTLYDAPTSITATITVNEAGVTLQNSTVTDSYSLDDVNLNGAFLDNATITNTNFSSSNLGNSNFNNSNVTNANMSNANLSESTMRNATMNGVNFTSAGLQRTDLSGANVRNSIFNNADLSGAILTRIDASGASFINANLRGANLSNADFTNANMTNADIDGADITNVTFTIPQKLQLLKNQSNRTRSEIQVSQTTGNNILAVVSAGSAVRDVPNIANATFKVISPTTTTFVSGMNIIDIILDTDNYTYFYFTIKDDEYFRIQGIIYRIDTTSTPLYVRNYATGAAVENTTYGIKAIRLLAGSLTIIVNSQNTLSTSSFVVPSIKQNTDAPFSPTTLPTSNSSAPIVYTSSNTNIATIDPSTGLITPVAGASGYVRFIASQVATDTHESASIMSNELFVNQQIDFTLVGLNQTLNLTTVASLDASSISMDATDATAVFYVRLSDMTNLFQYQTDAFDVNNIDASDVKYYVFHRTMPTELHINPSHAMMNKTESTGMLGTGIQEIGADKSLVKHDFVRYIALRLFNTHYGVDLFQNEQELHENITYLGETVQRNIDTILSNISTTSASQDMAYDASGNKYLTNDASGNTNLCRELMRQLAAAEPSRFYNNGADTATYGIRTMPLRENDSINFKLTITAAESQNIVTGVTVIPSRTYLIKMILKNTVSASTNANTVVTDSEMYPNSYPYSTSVVTYTPSGESSASVYNVYSPPAPIPTARYGYNGWYYVNSTTWVNGAQAVRDRVKWVLPPNAAGSSTVADLRYIRMNLKVFNTSSLAFLVVSTQAGSTRKYTISAPNSLTNGTVYSFYMNFNSYTREPATVGATNAAMAYSNVGSGSFANGEVITSIAVETDSAAASGSVEFTLSSVVIGEAIGEKEYGFSANV